MKTRILAIASAALAILAGCSPQKGARAVGGTTTIQVPKGRKVMTCTWKGEADLWYLTRPMRPDEKPEEITFHESSQYGLLQGTVVLQESR